MDLAIVHVDTDGPNKLTTLIAATGSDDFYRRTVVMDPANPSHALAVSFDPTDRPAAYATPRMSTSADVANALEARTVKLVAADKFAGTVMVERRGGIIFAKAWGLADRETKLPFALNTRLRIGSEQNVRRGRSVAARPSR